jgi:hypothetical protein
MIELSVVRDLVAIFGVIAGFSYYVLTVRNAQRNQQHQLELGKPNSSCSYWVSSINQVWWNPEISTTM